MRTRVRSAAPAAACPHVPPSSDPSLAAAENELAENELLVVNLDIPTLVERIFARAPELRELEADLEASGVSPSQRTGSQRTGSQRTGSQRTGSQRTGSPGTTPPGRVERLEQTAKELREVHDACIQLQARIPSASSVMEELAKMRHCLLRSANALAAAGLLRAQALEPYRQVRSQRTLARSVCGLVSVLLAQWEHIREHTPIQMAELERALLLARQFSLLSHQHRGNGTLAPALRERQRLFTALLKDYAELRRAAQLHHGREEANRRVPSLYGKSAQRTAAAR